MIALDNGDKIRGDASAATVVDYTLHGFVGTTATQLADGQLPAATGDLYTAAQAGIGVSSIILVNTDTVARTVNLYLLPSGGTARRLIPKNYSLGAGKALWTDGKVLKPEEVAVTAHNVLDGSTHPDTTLGTVVAGDIITGDATPKWVRLAKGTANYVLKAGASVLAWGQVAWTEITGKPTLLENVVEDTTPQLGGTLDLNDFNIQFKFEPTANLSASGLIGSVTVDTNAEGVGAPLFLAADGHFDTADADSSTTSPAVVLALETGTGVKKVLFHGILRNDAWNWTMGPGKASLIYVSTTTGTLTQAQPSGTDDVVQPVGWALSDDVIYFSPSMIYFTHT